MIKKARLWQKKEGSVLQFYAVNNNHSDLTLEYSH